MAGWSDFEQGAPELARDVAERLTARPAYLATVDARGAPRVHPVSPIVGGGRLFLFMEPTSPKGEDIRARGSFALHSGVLDNEGGGGEAFVRGRGVPVEDVTVRQVAASAAVYTPPLDRYILFELGVDEARATEYVDGLPHHRRWRA
jgi:hypothetical protein